MTKIIFKTLTAACREGLQEFTAQSGSATEFDALMQRLEHVRAGRRFTRDEMNEAKFFLVRQGLLLKPSQPQPALGHAKLTAI
jgi:hypothetical protein